MASGAAAAAQVNAAVLLTDGTTQDPATSGYLAANPNTSRFAVGTNSVRADPGAAPLTGADDFSVATAVANQFFSFPASAVAVNYLDASDSGIAAALAARYSAPILLVSASPPLPTATNQYLEDNKINLALVVVVGNTVNVSTGVLKAIQEPMR